jgi:solute carrier family 25 phosphate transporter 23/24/25/41
MRCVPQNAIRFGLYNHSDGVLGAITTGTAQVVVCYPLDVIRTRMSISTLKLLPCLKDVTSRQNGGVCGLYRGLHVAGVFNVGHVASQMYVYNYLRQNHHSSQLQAAVGAAVVSQTLFYPGDMLRRLYHRHDGNPPSVMSRIRVNVQKFGVARVFFAGYSANLIKAVPEVYVLFSVFEALVA